MDPTVPNSFIPKKSLEGDASRRSRASAMGLVLLVAMLIFIASIVAAAGAFLYQGYLKQSLASKQESLKRNEQAYDPGVIQELVRVDDRINEAKTLMQKHIAPSAIFAFLSQQTLEKVQLTGFSYLVNADGSAALDLKGIADSFSTVALQSDQLSASKVLKNVVFSGVSPDQKGNVAFEVNATLAPSVILYSNALASNPATVNTAPSTAPSVDASTTSQ